MFCYRHPDRSAYVRCQRCERYICPECQTEAAVGFLCPDDAGISRFKQVAAPLTPAPVQRVLRSNRPVATYALIAVCVLVWGLQLLLGDQFTYLGIYTPFTTTIEPWRMITSAFLHSPSSPVHILFNMYMLWVFGRELEQLLGRGKFLALYLISAFGGSVSVLLLASPGTYVYGASGAIYGLMGAYFVVLRSLGANSRSLVGTIAINLIFSFMIQGISWQAHVGGLITGAAVAWVYSRTRGQTDGRKRVTQVAMVVGALIVITAVGVARLGLGL